MYHLVMRSFARLLSAIFLLALSGNLAQSQEVTFRTYQDSTGFTCEFPSNWNFAQGADFNRIFRGSDESALNATIIIQVIDRSITAEKTPEAQLAALRPQFLQFPNGQVLTEGRAPIANQEAPYLTASYTANDLNGEARRFEHVQMVVTAPRVFLLMSYSAPDDTFGETLKVFQHCAATLTVPEPEAPTPPTRPEEVQSDDSAAVSSNIGEVDENTPIWWHNADRDFWIAVPSSWSKTVDRSEPYSVDMQHPERVEGVLIFVVDLDATSNPKEYADAWEEVLADEIFFMNERLAVPQSDHPNAGLGKASGLQREYQGATNGATLRSVAAFVVQKKRGFSVVGYHFIGDKEGEERIRKVVDSFRLVSPE